MYRYDSYDQSMVDARVEEFRDQYDFGTTSSASYGSAVRASDAAPATGRDDVVAGREFANFGDLELDRYDDVNILSRRLTEIAGDVGEVDTQISKELTSFTDDSEVFARIVSEIQGEITRSRMVPLELIFARLRLPIRDAAMKDAKNVRVVRSGDEATID